MEKPTYKIFEVKAAYCENERTVYLKYRKKDLLSGHKQVFEVGVGLDAHLKDPNCADVLEAVGHAALRWAKILRDRANEPQPEKQSE